MGKRETKRERVEKPAQELYAEAKETDKANYY